MTKLADGLPSYSSHQFSLTVRTELSDIKQVEVETSRLYPAYKIAVHTQPLYSTYPVGLGQLIV